VLRTEKSLSVLTSSHCALGHYQVEEIFDLAFNQFESLFGLLSVCVEFSLRLQHVMHALQ